MSVVMGVLIVSFGIWGIADIFKGFGQSTLATVGHTEISTEQFRQTYTDRLQQISRQFGRPLTSEQARQFGIDRQVLQQTIAEAALDEDARRMGLGISNKDLAQSIENDPNFAGINGKFDPQRFAETLRQFGFTEQRYVAEQRKVSLRRQIANTITAGVTPSKTQLEALERYQNEERTIEYVKLGAAQAGTIPEPTAEELSTFFDEHKAQFRAPEYRKIAVLTVTPADVAKTITVSDEDARKVFEQRRDDFAKPERREVLQHDAAGSECRQCDQKRSHTDARERALAGAGGAAALADAGARGPSIAAARGRSTSAEGRMARAAGGIRRSDGKREHGRGLAQ